MTTDATMSATASGVPVRITPSGRRPKKDYLVLTVDELAWLDKFRTQMLAQFPGSLEDIFASHLTGRYRWTTTYFGDFLA